MKNDSAKDITKTSQIGSGAVRPRPISNGMKISVRVTPKARRERFEKTGESEFTVAVREPSERNEANARVQRLVAAHYNVPVTNVRFLTGVHAKKKVFEIVQ